MAWATKPNQIIVRVGGRFVSEQPEWNLVVNIQGAACSPVLFAEMVDALLVDEILGGHAGLTVPISIDVGP